MFTITDFIHSLDFIKEYVTLRRKKRTPGETRLPVSLDAEHEFRLAPPGPHTQQLPGKERDMEIDEDLVPMSWPELMKILKQM